MQDPRKIMWAEACTLLERAEQLRRQFFEPAPDATRTARWEPPIDVLETERELWIIAALPGVAPEQVHVKIEDDTLTVAGFRPLPSLGRNADILRLEIPYGRFERHIALASSGLRLTGRELLHGCLVLTFSKLA
jgi:HSP20 family molecular chaperone IbpA